MSERAAIFSPGWRPGLTRARGTSRPLRTTASAAAAEPQSERPGHYQVSFVLPR